MREIRSLAIAIVLILSGGAARAVAISANDVTLSNIDAFKAQMIRDLPVGTENRWYV